MGPLDILNTAGSSLPTPTNFRAVQDPQRRNSFTAGASKLCQTTHSLDIAMGLPVFHPLYNG